MAKRKQQPAVIKADGFLKAADRLLRGLEKDSKASEKEVSGPRRALTQDTKGIASQAIRSMATEKLGLSRSLIPTGKNDGRITRARELTRDRFSRFRLQWLDKSQVRKLISQEAGWEKAGRANFFRHSNRLARNARMFLTRLGEVEPSLRDEIDATLRQMADASQNLLKLEVRSFTHVQESLLREVNGRSSKRQALASLRTFDLDRNLYNLSLLEHPKGVVRDLLAQASERMAARVATKKEQIPLLAKVFVAAGPDAVEAMTPSSRAAPLMWRVFTSEELTRRFAKLNKGRQTSSTWRDIGLGHNSPEWYVPIPPEVSDEVEEAMRKRRADFITSMQIKEAEAAEEKARKAKRDLKQAEAKQERMEEKLDD